MKNEYGPCLKFIWDFHNCRYQDLRWAAELGNREISKLGGTGPQGSLEVFEREDTVGAGQEGQDNGGEQELPRARENGPADQAVEVATGLSAKIIKDSLTWTQRCLEERRVIWGISPTKIKYSHFGDESCNTLCIC